jgi:hypothetical protein
MTMGEKNELGKHADSKVVQDGNTMPIDRLPEGAMDPGVLDFLSSMPSRYDVETFVREQHEFIKAQTRFLGVTNGAMAVANSTEYAAALTGYSLAQDRYVRALTRVLEQVRVL